MPLPLPAGGDAASNPASAHAHLIKLGSRDRAAYNYLITLYSRNGATLRAARRLFNCLPFPPSPVSWTSIISGHSHNPDAVLSLFRSLLRTPSSPLPLTHGVLSAVLKSLATAAWLTPSLSLHALAVKLALHRDPFSGSILVHLYYKCWSPVDAGKVLDEIPHRDEVCYGAAVVGLVQNRLPNEALSMFKRMQSEGIQSTMYVASGSLRAAAELAAMEQTQVLHAHVLVSGLVPNLVVATALLDAYGKSGVIEDAQKVFHELVDLPNLVVCNAMLSAYAQQGDAGATIRLFYKILERGLRPDELTFLAVLTACSNAGKVSDAKHWLGMMSSCYDLHPGLEHYTCLVSAMARVGHLEDAEHFAMGIPFVPDVPVWRALLSGCVAHGAIDMARDIGRRILELDPNDDSVYVMLGNIYAAIGQRNGKAESWTAMRDNGVKKEGGRSWVQVQGKVHVFVSGDRKHEMSDEIYAKLMELIEDAKKLGYSGSEEGLWVHSEKLALAFRVVCGVAQHGQVLRILKNLRICGDCHVFFKYVSKVLEKEILVRDVNRYHRFQSGVCTCGDFW